MNECPSAKGWSYLGESTEFGEGEVGGGGRHGRTIHFISPICRWTYPRGTECGAQPGVTVGILKSASILSLRLF